jgi:fructosamine-3-kinase
MQEISIENDLKACLEKDLGTRIESLIRISGGCISEAALISTSSAKSYFIKWKLNAPPGFFEAEAKGLNELKKCKRLIVPTVIHFSEQPRFSFIVLEVLGSSVSSHRHDKLGRSLAALHLIRADSFGLDHDNFIGTTIQKNSKESEWGMFFYNQRLLPQSHLGQKKGWMDDKMLALMQELKPGIIELLSQDPEAPSLLHGDLWSGNIFWSDKGPAFIDPAVYYGHREADIAMSELFGGFGADFYISYQEIYPLSKFYPNRREILNLYHLMNHANIFSGHYIKKVRDTLNSLKSII